MSHFRSYSEQANSIIRFHSDSQQSLDRLFNPTQTTVPLRNRNLPLSFFNPGYKPDDTNDNNNNHSNNGSTNNINHVNTHHVHSHNQAHSRSISFDQRGTRMHQNLHMRTQSTLAPMPSLAANNSNNQSQEFLAYNGRNNTSSNNNLATNGWSSNANSTDDLTHTACWVHNQATQHMHAQQAAPTHQVQSPQHQPVQQSMQSHQTLHQHQPIQQPPPQPQQQPPQQQAPPMQPQPQPTVQHSTMAFTNGAPNMSVSCSAPYQPQQTATSASGYYNSHEVAGAYQQHPQQAAPVQQQQPPPPPQQPTPRAQPQTYQQTVTLPYDHHHHHHHHPHIVHHTHQVTNNQTNWVANDNYYPSRTMFIDSFGENF